MNYQPTERRPIAARRWTIWQRAATWLAARGVSPNGISLAGMLCGMLAGIALAGTARTGPTHTGPWGRALWITAAACIQLRLLANLLDGMVAMESCRASRVGELYNEIPDRVSDTATIVGAGYAVGGDAVIGFIAALVAMFTAYVRTAGKGSGAPHEYCGPMAKQQRMALLTAVALYCGLTPRAWQPAFDDAGHGPVTICLAIIVVGGLITALRRLAKIAAHLKGKPS